MYLKHVWTRIKWLRIEPRCICFQARHAVQEAIVPSFELLCVISVATVHLAGNGRTMDRRDVIAQ
jgi:hypothetical protein